MFYFIKIPCSVTALSCNRKNLRNPKDIGSRRFFDYKTLFKKLMVLSSFG